MRPKQAKTVPLIGDITIKKDEVKAVFITEIDSAGRSSSIGKEFHGMKATIIINK